MKKIRWKVAQFFEKKWWQNYLKTKTPKEYLDWKTKYWFNFLKEINFDLSLLKNQNLDIGCGPAGTFILSNETESNWTAVDPLLNNYAALEIFETKKYSKVKFENSSFEAYETSQKFDVIFCLNAINHFITLKENFEKLNFLLTKEGKLVLSTDAHNYKILKWILYILPLDILHPHQYTAAEYENMIQQSGFRIISKTRNKKEFIFSYYVYVLEKSIL